MLDPSCTVGIIWATMITGMIVCLYVGDFSIPVQNTTFAVPSCLAVLLVSLNPKP